MVPHNLKTLILENFLKQILVGECLFNPLSRPFYVHTQSNNWHQKLVFWSRPTTSKVVNTRKDNLKGVDSKTLIFNGEKYAFWKECIFFHLISLDKRLWIAIKDNPFDPKSIIDDIGINKPLKVWNDEETKQTSYDFKSINILIFSLIYNVYLSISHCKTVKTTWDTLQVLNEETKDVKQFKTNTLTK